MLLCEVYSNQHSSGFCDIHGYDEPVYVSYICNLVVAHTNIRLLNYIHM